jgi:hypothetical protein
MKTNQLSFPVIHRSPISFSCPDTLNEYLEEMFRTVTFKVMNFCLIADELYLGILIDMRNRVGEKLSQQL